MKQFEWNGKYSPEWVSLIMSFFPDKLWLMLGFAAIVRTEDEPPSELKAIDERLNKVLESTSKQAIQVREATEELEKKFRELNG